MSRPRPQHPTRRRAGYTLIEVMIAMLIMVFGVMSIVRLQAQTLRNVTLAREMGTAMQVAQNAIEALKLDGRTWTQPATLDGMGVPTNQLAPDVLGSTIWLRYVPVGMWNWQTFSFPEDTLGVAPGNNMVASPAADFYGRPLEDTAGALANAHFCTSMRLSWVQIGRSIRADVRVYWRKDLSVSGAPNLLPERCTDPADGSLNPGVFPNPDPDYHVVYLSTVIPVSEDPANP